ncbi:hypothetical protein F5144DRAFT_498587, partial [Chaetomium tenue]
EVSVCVEHHDYEKKDKPAPRCRLSWRGIFVRAHWSNADSRDGMSFMTGSSGLRPVRGNINMHRPRVAILVDPGIEEGNGRHMANLGAE